MESMETTGLYLNEDSIKTKQANGAPVRDETQQNGDTAPSTSSASESVKINIVWGKQKFEIARNLDMTVSDLKDKLEEVTGVPKAMQKLMLKGLMKNDTTLRSSGVNDGCKVILIGSTLNDVVAANAIPSASQIAEEEKSAPKKEPMSKQKIHSKIIEKGIPDDAIPGIRNAQDELPDQPLSGMLNKTGGKVRLTFKLELDELWIGTKERTNKIPMAQIQNVVSEPIEGFEQYHIMGVQLGPTEASRYWIYWVPAQYVSAIKSAVLGSPFGRM